MVSSALANREALRSSQSDAESFSSPSSSSSSYEELEEEKGNDIVSLSTCSMSTNPTPDNPLYIARGAVVPKKQSASIDERKASIIAENPHDGTSVDVVDEIIRTTTKLEISGDESTKMQSNPNYNGSNIEDSSLYHSGNVVATTGLHIDFNSSPEPLKKGQMQQITLATSHGTENNKIAEDHQNIMNIMLNNNYAEKFDAVQNIREEYRSQTTAADRDVNEREKITQSSLNLSSSIFSSGAGSPIGANLVLRKTDNTTTETQELFKYSENYSERGRLSLFKELKPSTLFFSPQYICTSIAYKISCRIFDDADDDFAVATWLGFWAYLNVSCANLILKPIMDAVVLELGVENQPKLIFASSILAFLSSVPIGWLFEAPDPKRRKVFKKMGMTRGETQGSSLALFYRFFAFSAISYAIGFQLVDIQWIFETKTENGDEANKLKVITFLFKKWGQCVYIAFFLVIHLMKLHSTSLVWGVTTEAMEYEEIARKQHENSTHPSLRRSNNNNPKKRKKQKTRLQRLARIQLGGTLGSIWGSTLTSSLAEILHLPGLLAVSAFLLEISAELSIELGRIMQKHWEEQQIFKSNQDLTSLDPSMKRSSSSGSMKRVASGNSLYQAQQQHSMKRVASGNSIHSFSKPSNGSLVSMANLDQHNKKANEEQRQTIVMSDVTDDNTFTQRLSRGIHTILKSRLLLTIFIYNALFSSINTLLSFQRAGLVAKRKESTTVSADTAFLANINFVSSLVMFAMQSSGTGALITQMFGTRGSLALMPLIRLGGLICLCWWHRSTDGRPPNLTLFLMLDEFTKVVNQAVAKPVRESLWSDLNNEARYEAKPIIDVLANRWGAGSASFCVYAVSRIIPFCVFVVKSILVSMESFLRFFGWNLELWGWKDEFLNQTPMENGDQILGLPPVLLLGLIVSAWWVGVSLDLGQLRARIDLELKKHK